MTKRTKTKKDDIAESSRERKSIRKASKKEIAADDVSSVNKGGLGDGSVYGFSPGDKSTYGKSSYKARGSIRKSTSKSKETDVLMQKF